MAARKPRFVLVDPSFDGTTGDKWQYAVAFAASAAANGYEFHLASARTSPSITAVHPEIIEHRVFTHGFYQHDKIVSRHELSPENAAERALALRYTRKINRAEQDIKRAWDRNDRAAVELGERRLRAIKREAARVAQESEQRRVQNVPVPFNRDDYGLALAELIEELDLGAGDRLFFHTVTPAMMESLSEARLRLGIERVVEADAHFLFHFGAEASDARTFLDRYYSYSHFGSMAQRLRTGSPFKNNYLLATSPELAEECSELFGVPCGLFEGLTNLGVMMQAIGGEAAEAELRANRSGPSLKDRPFRVVVRAVDIKPETCDALKAAVSLFKGQGLSLDLRVIYHHNAIRPLRDIAAVLGDDVTFVDTEDNDDYIRAMAQADLAVLSYVAEHYAKRVSAVLHDCSVIGVPCLVPAETTMSRTAEYADITIYEDVSELPGLIYSVWKQRTSPQAGEVSDSRMAEARRRFATDVVERVIAGQTSPAIVAEADPKVVVVVMPAWGRCGSSFAMEAQIRFFVNAGYFVIQTFMFDKPIVPMANMDYLWLILRENSVYTRGNVQRIMFTTPDRMEALEDSDDYLAMTPFHQHLSRVAAGEIVEPALAKACREADLTVVNHVFHSAWAKRNCGGPMILETHDIQSYQMAKWPLIDARDEMPAALSSLLKDEMAEVATFDHVINVAPEEHRILSLSAKASTLLVPYIPLRKPDPAMKRISDLIPSEGWGVWYEGIDQFDLLLAGDSHPANVESAHWFIAEVYKPFLQPKGYRLAITGRLSDKMYERFEGEMGVFYAGFVKDLTTIRALSKVSVLPDRRGTGISIKTLETFQERAAFVATPVAMRGLESDVISRIPTFESAAAFANEAKRLIENPKARDALREVGRQAYESVSGEVRFNGEWQRIVTSLTAGTDAG
ncbi:MULTISPECIES: glycosyltransferase [unclassified Brevundimonas]|uniref:glycosyltransferase n=1 Tax=unclassified Brevundimonas TaxID=2622653 RepID=UPI0025C20A93|nr:MULTISPECIES: glycosyltransferase [unclassified Brevundimonas]